MDYKTFDKTYSSGLTEGQKLFFKEFLGSKRSIFLTGGAGTGKSHVIKLMSKFCEENGILISKTASTGIAAVNISAQTLHSFLGIGIGNETGELLFKKIRKNKKTVQRIKSCKNLFIDEISMISGELLDKVYSIFEYFCRSQPRYILAGDFFQLLAILKEDKTLAFESNFWKKVNPKVINLTEIVRQKDGSDLAVFLSKIRVGDKSDLSFLEDLIIDESEIPSNSMVLFSRNIDVDYYNNQKLMKMPGELRNYYSNDEGQEPHLSNLRKNCLAPEVLKLKVGASVMLLKNLSPDLVNGSVGIVTKLEPNSVTVSFDGIEEILMKEDWKIEESFINDQNKIKTKVLASRSQIPLRLSFSSSTHKSQGLTIDKVVVDVSDCFAPGQFYVALSRARTKEGLKIIGFNPRSIKTDDRCLEFYRNLEQ